MVAGRWFWPGRRPWPNSANRPQPPTQRAVMSLPEIVFLGGVICAFVAFIVTLAAVSIYTGLAPKDAVSARPSIAPGDVPSAPEVVRVTTVLQGSSVSRRAVV